MPDMIPCAMGANGGLVMCDGAGHVMVTAPADSCTPQPTLRMK